MLWMDTQPYILSPPCGPRIHATVLIIQDEVKKLPPLRKHLSTFTQRLFATDLALVAHRVRTGYLVDIIFPENPVETFSNLVAALRTNQHTKDLFATILHLFEPTSEQSFFVNTALLAGRMGAALPLTHWGKSCSLPAVFIHVLTPIRILDSIPTDLKSILESLFSLSSTIDPVPLSFSLPIGVNPETAVPLAALLLDYPIAYVPSTSNPHALSGSALDFYECILVSEGRNHTTDSKRNDIKRDGHTIMKFSCPAQLAGTETARCDPASIISQLKKMFAERLQLLEEPNLVCNVVHTVRSPDHVAF